MRKEKQIVRDFYEGFGWERNAEGAYNDTAAFVDIRPELRSYQEASMRRLASYFHNGGRLFLDAGCGATPSEEYVALGKAYQKRVCVDFSRKALIEAREALGSSALPVLADINALPFREDTFDAVLCAHVVYHMPQEEQTGAIEELNRVLGTNGTGVVVYIWSKCLMTRLALFLNPRLWAPKIPGMRWVWRRFFKKATTASTATSKLPEHPPLFFSPNEYSWYRNELRKRVPVSLACWQSVSLPFSQAFIFGSYSATIFLGIARRLEQCFPRLMGRIGAYPLFILQKKSKF